MRDFGTKFRLFVTAAILIPVLLYWGFASSPQEQVVKPGKLNEQIDFFASEANLKEWSSNGQLQSMISAHQLEHSTTQSVHYLTAPETYIFHERGGHTRITANTAIAHDDNSRTDLAGDVIVKDNPPKGKILTLTTEQLTVYPQQQKAESDILVTVSEGKQKLKGVGMDMDLNSRIMNLHSDVKGIH